MKKRCSHGKTAKQTCKHCIHVFEIKRKIDLADDHDEEFELLQELYLYQKEHEKKEKKT